MSQCYDVEQRQAEYESSISSSGKSEGRVNLGSWQGLFWNRIHYEHLLLIVLCDGTKLTLGLQHSDLAASNSASMVWWVRLQGRRQRQSFFAWIRTSSVQHNLAKAWPARDRQWKNSHLLAVCQENTTLTGLHGASRPCSRLRLEAWVSTWKPWSPLQALAAFGSALSTSAGHPHISALPLD